MVFATKRRREAQRVSLGSGVLPQIQPALTDSFAPSLCPLCGEINKGRHFVPPLYTVVEVNSASGPKARADADTSTTPIATFAFRTVKRSVSEASD